jgi:hypothetical protein
LSHVNDYRKAHPESIGETDAAVDYANYADWSDEQIVALRKRVEEMEGALTRISISEFSGVANDYEELHEFCSETAKQALKGGR